MEKAQAPPLMPQDFLMRSANPILTVFKASIKCQILFLDVELQNNLKLESFIMFITGLWEIILTDVPGIVSGIGANRLNFTRVYISGNKATYSQPIKRGGGVAVFTEVDIKFSKNWKL